MFDLKKPPEPKEVGLQGALDSFKKIAEKQGEECERRHNCLCRIKEILDEYFKET